MTMNKFIGALILAFALASPAMAAKTTKAPAPKPAPVERCVGTMGDFADFIKFVEQVNNIANVAADVLTPAQRLLLEQVLGPIPDQFANTDKVVVVHNDEAAIIALIDNQGCLLAHTKPVSFQELGPVLGLTRAKD